MTTKSSKLYKLTDEHRAQFEPWRDKWISNAMSTQPMSQEDRAICIEAVNGLYASANLPLPKHIVFVPSPFVLTFAAGFAAAIWKKSHEAATRAATEAATGNATPNPSWYRFGANMPAIDKSFGLNGFGLSLAREAYRWFQGGNQWSGYDSYLSFFRHIAQLQLDYSTWQHWETLSLHSGPRIVHADFCMICERPELLLVDAQNRPHNPAGPFCRWRDGSALYSVRGIRVPWDVIEDPSSVTVERIKAESNSEVRRVMIDLYGQAKYLADAKLRLLDSSIWGDLYQETITSGVDPWTAVRVVNGTPDVATGEKAIYILPVHHECRPMWIDETGQKQFGDPQKLTALNAVASTYGATGKDYEAGFLGRS